MISHELSLVLVQAAKSLGTVYALLGLAAFLYSLPRLGEFKYSPPRLRDADFFVDEVTLSLNDFGGRNTSEMWMETVSWQPRAAIAHNFLTD